MTDPLDRLLRESAGPRPDPATSRRVVRAALGPGLSRRRRRDARARVVRTTALAVAMTVVLCGQLGSDDFETTVTTLHGSGSETLIYRQGLRGEEVRINHYWTESGRNRQDVEELLQQRAADDGVFVGLQGFQFGQERLFRVAREYEVNGRFLAETDRVRGWTTQSTARIKAFVMEDKQANYEQLRKVSGERAPDFVVPMYLDGLTWVVNGWRITLPGREEIIYYEGLRADGVRSRDGLPY